jgi:hypothetical protein
VKLTHLRYAKVNAVIRRPLAAEARVRSRFGQFEICGGQSVSGTGFSPSTSVFPYHFHSTGATLNGKTENFHPPHKGCTTSLQSHGAPQRRKKPLSIVEVNPSVANVFHVIYRMLCLITVSQQYLVLFV